MDESKKKSSDWFFTFGCGQAFPGGYVRINAQSSARAREKMLRLFSDRWSMQYDDEESAGVEKYGLRLVGEYTVHKDETFTGFEDQHG